MGEGLPAPSPVSHFFSFFPHICFLKNSFNKLGEGSCQWGGRAGPDPLPGQRRDLGPAQACAGGPAAPCGRAGGRGVRPHRDVLAGACGRERAGLRMRGRPPPARPGAPPGSPPRRALTSVKAS